MTEAMKNGRVELTVGGKTLAEVKIQRGVFQCDALTNYNLDDATQFDTYEMQ